MNNKKKKRNKKSVTTKTSVPIKQYVVEKILWKDHFSANNKWCHVEELRTRPMVNATAGIVVAEDKDTVTLAMNMGENELIADTTTILKNCITKRVKLGTIDYGVQ